MAQLFGQTEAPMMISTMAPKDHFRRDGTIARERLSAAGRPSSLLQVGVMDKDGRLLPTGERGEIVVRGSLVSPGYYENPEATGEASRHNWRHTADIGYLDADNIETFMYIGDENMFFATMATRRISAFFNLQKNLANWRARRHGPILVALNVDATWDNATATHGLLDNFQPIPSTSKRWEASLAIWRKASVPAARSFFSSAERRPEPERSL